MRGVYFFDSLNCLFMFFVYLSGFFGPSLSSPLVIAVNFGWGEFAVSILFLRSEVYKYYQTIGDSSISGVCVNIPSHFYVAFLLF